MFPQYFFPSKALQDVRLSAEIVFELRWGPRDDSIDFTENRNH